MKELISKQVALAEVKAWFDDRDMDGSHLLAVLEQIPEEETIPEDEFRLLVKDYQRLEELLSESNRLFEAAYTSMILLYKHANRLKAERDEYKSNAEQIARMLAEYRMMRDSENGGWA